MLRVTPIYGSHWEREGPASRGSCTLVEYANVRVLVNVGGPVLSSEISSAAGTKSGSTSAAAAAATATATGTGYFDYTSIPEHDCLVVSDSTMECIGGLPLYCAAHPSKPVFATFPTVKMGQMTLWDGHAHISLDGGAPPYTLEQMDAAIAQLQTIKFSQSISLPIQDHNSYNGTGTGTGTGAPATPQLSITAHRAAHVVGGAFWVLQRLQDETVVVITSSAYSIAKELHLESSTLLKYGATPDVLVTYPGGPAMPLLRQLYTTSSSSNTTTASTTTKTKPRITMPLASQAQRQLTEQILSVLRRDGNVLLPVDASGRVLELILLLSQQWEKQRLQQTYNLVWLGPMVGNTLDFARSQLEWMNGKLGHAFDHQNAKGGHPYALRGVQLCANVNELERFLEANPNPTCVVANGLTLDHGPARDLLLKWADNDNNAVIFTDSAQSIGRNWNTMMTTQQPPQLQQQQQQQPQQQLQPAVTVSADTSMTTTTSTSITTATTAQQQQQQQTLEAAAAAVETEPGDTETEAVVATGQAISKAQASRYTTAFQLLQRWCQAKLEDREMEDSIQVDVLVPRRAPLAGPELQWFLEQEEAARQSRRQQEEQAAMLREVELAKGRLRLGEETKDGSKSSSTPTQKQNPNLKFLRPKKKSRFDSSLFLKFSKPLHLMFDVREDAVGVGQRDHKLGLIGGETEDVVEDDYGIAILPDHFVDIVTGVDPSKFAGGSGRIGEEVMRRGFGFGTSAGGASDGNKDGRAKNKKRNNLTSLEGGGDGNEEDDDEEGLDERGLEAMDLSEGRGIIRGRNGRPPTKVTTEPRRIQVFCEIDYIPLEGRVDSRSARQSVRALQPRQVVVLGGPKPATSTEDTAMGDATSTSTKEGTAAVAVATDEVTVLAEAAQSFLSTNKRVSAPSDTETAELDVGHAAFSVRLIATPYRRKEQREQEEEPPEPLELHEAKLGACAVSLLDYVATGQKVALDGSIVLAPRKMAPSGNPVSIYLSDGEVLLTDLRTELIAQGMKAAYSTHSGYAQLVINGKVIVKKDKDSGKIDVEGPLCEDFFTVRSVVCGQYVTL